MWRNGVAAVSLLVLAACSSVGVQYKQPVEGTSSAVVVGGKGTYIYTFDEEGCYTGKTEINEKKGLRVFPDKEAIFGYEDYPMGNRYCQMVFSFVPERDAKYKIDADHPYEHCRVLVTKSNSFATGVPVSLKHHYLNMGFLNTCIRFPSVDK
ncbi:MAG TPA: hypothetical protein VFW68_01460 [Rhodocyclaceae bacterium]|nr:hypothetical protein [Rhodocyclaceae bacterium]